MSDLDLAKFMEPVARALLGEPNASLSKTNELRFGKNGSLSVDLERGVAFDYEEDAGGGVLWLVEKRKGLTGAEAFAYLREDLHLDIPDTRERGLTRPQGKNGGGDDHPFAPGNDDAPPAGAPRTGRKLVKTYDYCDAQGSLLYQVCRFEPKSFGQRRPSGLDDGSWIWGLDAGEFMRKGPGKDWIRFNAKNYEAWKFTERRRFDDAVPHSLYRIVEFREELADGVVVFLPEGEKDSDTIVDRLGLPATTNSGGAKHWSPEHAEFFRGCDVVIPIDNDDAGRSRADIIGRSLRGIAKRVRVLDFSAVIDDFPPKDDITDWVEKHGGTAEQLFELLKRCPDWVDPGFKSKLGGYRWQDIFKANLRYEWLIKGLVARREVTIIAGPPQSGKSFLATDMGLAIARGLEWWGRKTIKGAVVYVAAESGIGVVSLRLPAYAQHHNLSFETDDVPFLTITKRLNFFADDKDVNALIAEIKAFEADCGIKVELVVLDTWSAITPGAKENASESVGPILKRARRVVDEAETALVIVHHMNAEGAKVRGHTSLTGDVEGVIIVTQSEDAKDAEKRPMRTAKAPKVKEGAAGFSWDFVLKGIDLGTDADGDKITSCVVDRPAKYDFQTPDDTGKLPGEIELRGANARLLLQALCAALAENGVPIASDIKAPPGFKMVRKDHWREHYARIAPAGERDAEGAPEDAEKKMRERVKKAVDRASEKFVTMGIISADNPFVWPTGRPVKGFDMSFAATGQKREKQGQYQPSQGQDGEYQGQNNAGAGTTTLPGDDTPF